jgi:glycosyltransferase involved in cell wall biosynthesis
VLMVLYFYPPVGGISMSRNVRNVQYLPRHGWRPIVLTVRNAAYPLRDADAVRLIPEGTRVIRTGSIEAGHVRRRILGLVGVVRRRHAAGEEAPHLATGGASVGATSSVGGRSGSLLERLRRLVFFPDDEIGWLPFAVVAAIRAYRTTPYDAIYSTSSPVSAHLIAALVKRWTGRPWIAEFRDPWRGNALAAPLPGFHRRLQARLERWLIGSADRVVGVSSGITELYRTRYPAAPAMVTITSGYDRGELIPPRPRTDGRFRVVYTGTLDRPDELGIFLDGVALVLGRRPELRDRLQFRFYGLISDSCRAVLDRYAAEPVGNVVEVHGFVPRHDALEALASADSALILLGAGPGMGLFIGGKLFDYIGQNRQILAMLPVGDSRRILEELDWGVVCDPEPAAVADALERLLELPPPSRPADPEGRYDRATLAGRLADSLDDVTRGERA